MEVWWYYQEYYSKERWDTKNKPFFITISSSDCFRLKQGTEKLVVNSLTYGAGFLYQAQLVYNLYIENIDDETQKNHYIEKKCIVIWYVKSSSVEISEEDLSQYYM